MNSERAKIYLADQRGGYESISHRSLYTFNYGSYFDVHREPFFELSSLNDETLSAGSSATYSFTNPKHVLILPVVGTIECKATSWAKHLDAGQVYYFLAKSNMFLEVTNPLQRELVNYLFLEFEFSGDHEEDVLGELPIENEYDKLHKLTLTQHRELYLGIYNGRAETNVVFDEGENIFVFIIEGAFEVNNRLLHKGDALSLERTFQLEFEALSNNAIILAVKL